MLRIYVTFKYFLLKISPLLSLAGIVVILLLRSLFTLQHLFTLLLIVVLFFFTIFILSNINPREFNDIGREEPSMRLMKKNHYFLYTFIVFYSVSLYYDFTELDRRSYSVFVLSMVLGYLAMEAVFLRRQYRSGAVGFLLFLMLSFTASIYFLYPPSLGNDTWRDAIVSSKILDSGRFSGLTLHEAYSLPLVSILYSMFSLALGIGVLGSTAVIGIVYMILIILLVPMIVRLVFKSDHVKDHSAFLSVLLSLSIPMISLWSVWFIPQAYALIMLLLLLGLLFLHSRNRLSISSGAIAGSLLIISMVIGHGGVALFAVGFMVVFLLMMGLFAVDKASYRTAARFFGVIVIVTATYFIYTAILELISTGISSILRLLITFLSGSLVAESRVALPGDPIATALLSYGSIAVCLALAVASWLAPSTAGAKDPLSKAFTETAFLYGSLMLIIAFVGNIYRPELTLDRYLGLGSLLLFTIISAKSFEELRIRGTTGAILTALLSIIIVLSLCFGGTLTSDLTDQFNVANAYSVRYVPTYADFKNLELLAPIINSRHILIDWRTGLPLIYLLAENSVDVPGGYIDIRVGGYTVRMIGYYGYVVTYNDIAKHLESGWIFIYRPKALDKLGLLQGANEEAIIYKLLMISGQIYRGTVLILTG